MDSLHVNVSTSGGADKYPSKAHAKRIRAELGAPKGLILLAGTRSAYFENSDQKIPFRQDRYFYYLTGCNEPDCFVTYETKGDWLTLWLPKVDYSRYFYDGRGSTPAEAMRKYDIDQALDLSYEDGQSMFECYMNASGGDINNIALLQDEAHLPDEEPPLLSGKVKLAFDACRAVKDEHEIALVLKANEISAKAHKDVLLNLHTLKTEADAEAVYMRTCIANLARKQAYDPIFGSGPNAGTLHYVDNVESLEDRQLLLVDAGCEYQSYASDVTRTIPLNRENPGQWPSLEAQQIYQAVEKIQETCIKLMKPGARFSDVNEVALRLTLDALLELGILKGDREEIYAAGTTRAFFPHGLGHHIGLEVHDVDPPVSKSSAIALQREEGRSPAGIPLPFGFGRDAFIKRSTSTVSTAEMKPGNIITIEPGIYFNHVVLSKFVLPHPVQGKFIDRDVLKRYMPVGGVRIEDDILITRYGHQNLTIAPKGEEMLKILRQASQS